MKTIITLDRANQPYGYPQLDGSGSLQATGSLYGTASWASNSTWSTATETARYDLVTYNFTNNDIVTFNGLRPFSIQGGGNYNPNYLKPSSILSYLSYVYVDIVDNTNNTEHRRLNFANEAAIVTYVSSSGIADGRLTFYSYKNDTSNLNVGGSNQLATYCTSAGRNGKISSKRRFPVDPGAAGTVALYSYISSSFYNDISSSIGGNVDEIITQQQIDTILGNTRLFFLNFDKYKDRKKSGLYINPTGVEYIVSGSNTMVATSGRTKIIASALMRFNRTATPTAGDFGIEHACRTYNDAISTFSRNRSTGNNYSYFNLYVLQDVANDGRALVVEFLTIDAVTIPFTSKVSDVIPAYKYFVRKGSKFEYFAISNTLTTPRTDAATYMDFAELPMPFLFIQLKRPYTNVSLVRLYENGTCDVFEDCLKVVTTTYAAKTAISGGKNNWKLWYYKLNKRP